jgi:hypothetical protein
MKRGNNLVVACVTVAGAFIIWATPAFAYLGPGAGLVAIGSFLALVVGVIAAFFGFLWYPVKRLLGKRHAAGAYPSDPQQTPHAKAGDKGV